MSSSERSQWVFKVQTSVKCRHARFLWAWEFLVWVFKPSTVQRDAFSFSERIVWRKFPCLPSQNLLVSLATRWLVKVPTSFAYVNRECVQASDETSTILLVYGICLLRACIITPHFQKGGLSLDCPAALRDWCFLFHPPPCLLRQLSGWKGGCRFPLWMKSRLTELAIDRQTKPQSLQ